MIPNSILHYKIEKKLGEGGMGEVFLATDTKLDRKVALKFLPPHFTNDPEFKARFEHEARATAALNHPNIVTVFELNEHVGRLFIAMEYVDGQSLETLIAAGDLPLDRTINIMRQICEGLDDAHRVGIVHRDIKPSNILFDEKGRVKILDFGLARMEGSARLTRTGSTVGTAAYMSPEQAEGKEIDQRADIWSLGVVLYEMLTGRLPFGRDHEQATIYAILNEEPEPLGSFRSGIPQYFEQIIRTALEKDRDRRFQNIQVLLQDLQAEMVSPIAAPKQEKSLAVLPFENMSPDPDQEYFSDGLTEEIITDLSQIRDLLVISRSSAMTFKGTKKKIREIARELNVHYVLEGSVRKAGNNLRITAQLIDAANDSHLWADKYKGTLDDVFDIQEKVSRSIVNSLALKLSATESENIAQHPIDNIPAYEAYLRANAEIHKFTEDAMDRALQYLQSALDIIGESALLYSGMAWTYWSLVNIGAGHDEYIVKAEECVKRALTIDPGYAKAHALLGWIATLQGEPTEMVGHFKRALATNPDEKQALTGSIVVYEFVGKTSVADPLLERLMRIDPLDFGAAWFQGGQHFYDGRYDDALRAWRRCYERYPENPYSRFSYALILSYHNQLGDAFPIIDQSAKGTPNNVLAKLGLMLKYGLQGEEERAFRELTPDFRTTCQRDATYSHHLAGVFALLGEKEHALNWLGIAVGRGFLNYPLLSRKDPWLESLRGEERFKKLMERVKREWEEFEV